MSPITTENERLMKASKWAEREFTKCSAPQNRTIKNWVLKGKVRGKVVDENVFVFENERFGIPKHISDTVSALIAASQ
ncbi:hypothetical protein [Shewanella sp. Isolate11]|uniref:hypothetical protein n=1 Tax=Shewanella sp. Isolate11 TaxID=2908530 RepID=UPI001EFC3916|nr:hypothetical protein [Shewanella sp. Isolate11]MCG9698366.1 hypothetical protein [Shewanella sp. Isolate11]